MHIRLSLFRLESHFNTVEPFTTSLPSPSVSTLLVSSSQLVYLDLFFCLLFLPQGDVFEYNYRRTARLSSDSLAWFVLPSNCWTPLDLRY